MSCTLSSIDYLLLSFLNFHFNQSFKYQRLNGHAGIPLLTISIYLQLPTQLPPCLYGGTRWNFLFIYLFTAHKMTTYFTKHSWEKMRGEKDLMRKQLFNPYSSRLLDCHCCLCVVRCHSENDFVDFASRDSAGEPANFTAKQKTVRCVRWKGAIDQHVIKRSNTHTLEQTEHTHTSIQMQTGCLLSPPLIDRVIRH